MARVEIYTGPACGYCMMAKRLLKAKNVAFEEISLGDDPRRRDEMMRRSGGRRTVPQIFIDGQAIGGFDDISALDRQGGLDPLLGR